MGRSFGFPRMGAVAADRNNPSRHEPERSRMLARSFSRLGMSAGLAVVALGVLVARVDLVRAEGGSAKSAAVPEKITEEYARLVARDTYFWAWPLVNIQNRRATFTPVPQPMLSGPLPIAPPNRLTMLTDYIEPEERAVACPNQDVVYGNGVLALDQSAVVIQVPEFGDRFWVYQIVDGRTDSFAALGKMYGTRPGFYLLVGPDWQGELPKGISGAFRASTNNGVVIPRVFQD